MQDYVDPTETNLKLTSSLSMYVKIKSWLLNGAEEDTQELIRGASVNLKVRVKHFLVDL